MSNTKSLTGITVVLLLSQAVLFAQPAAQPPGVPTTMVITLEPKKGKTIPPVVQDDLQVTQNRNDKRPILELRSLRESDTQMMLLIDDSARFSFGTELNTLRNFINELSPNTAIGIGYMRNGMTQMVADFTRDHGAAAAKLRLTLGVGGADVSPYDSLTDAIKKWPQPFADRREVVMISSGIEGLGGGYNPDNPYVNAGIEEAQKAGIVVYAIYNPSAGHFGHSYWRNNWGQNFLSQLADETGGESYMIGFGSPVSFEPFLRQILAAQRDQYLLTFAAIPEKKSGLQPVRVSVIEKDASLAAPDKVYVKAGM